MNQDREIIISPRIVYEVDPLKNMAWTTFNRAESLVRVNPDLNAEELRDNLGKVDECLFPFLNDEISRHFRNIETGHPTGPYAPSLVSDWTKTGNLLRQAYGLEGEKNA